MRAEWGACRHVVSLDGVVVDGEQRGSDDLHAVGRRGTAKGAPRVAQILCVQHAVAVADEPSIVDGIMLSRFHSTGRLA